jgi:hypothetical protein
MTTKTKVTVGVVLIAAAFATGYYAAPYKIKTEIKTVEVEKKTDTTQADTEAHRKTVKVEKTKPDGSKTVTTTTTTDVDKHVDSMDTDTVSKTTDKSKEVTKSNQPLTVSVLSGVNLTNGLGPATVVYGGAVTKAVLGPITIGVFGLSSGTYGASVGLQF